MMFQEKREQIVIGAIFLSLIGLAIIQIGWLNKAITTNKQLFAQNMDRGAKQTAEMYRDATDLPETVHQLILQNKPNEIDSLLKPIINRALAQNNLPLNYEYGIYKHKGHQQNQLIFGTTNLDVLKSSECNQIESRTFGWSSLTCNLGYGKDNSYHLAIFPSYSSFIFSRVKFSLLAFIFFLSLISLGFYYLLKTINKQKRVSEIKNDFINNLTHEFKTPIFSMSLASKSLRKSFEPDDKLNTYIDVIDNESNRLKRQVDKILQLSLIDSELFGLEKSPIDIHQQLVSVVDNLKLVLKEKGGKINLELKAENVIVMADEIHLKNVWYNLIDNAIKYSKDKPEITIETINLIGEIQVLISDNGIGMSQDKQKMIFDKFYRISTGNIYQAKGFGIGLSYAKRIIEIYHGQIYVDSKIGDGSTFKIKLPINEN